MPSFSSTMDDDLTSPSSREAPRRPRPRPPPAAPPPLRPSLDLSCSCCGKISRVFFHINYKNDLLAMEEEEKQQVADEEDEELRGKGMTGNPLLKKKRKAREVNRTYNSNQYNIIGVATFRGGLNNRGAGVGGGGYVSTKPATYGGGGGSSR